MEHASSFGLERRIALVGSQQNPTEEFAAFCSEVGRLLALSSTTVIALGGRKGAANEFANGFINNVDPKELENRIAYYLIEDESIPKDYVGRIVKTGGRSREVRRFRMVHDVDGVIGVCGASGTDQQLTFAVAIEKPVLPVPSFGGSSNRIWIDHREQLIERLGLSSESAQLWERTPDSLNSAKELAAKMVPAFLTCIRQKCFVIMPFREDFSALIDLVIDPVVTGAGDEVIHLGRREQPGNVKSQITEGISKADYVVCVLDEMRPNVLFELGMAHALLKPAILLWKNDPSKPIDAPFDLAHEQRIEYDIVDNSLKKRLADAVRYVRQQLVLKLRPST